jgi:excisionase family DNA binding protein
MVAHINYCAIIVTMSRATMSREGARMSDIEVMTVEDVADFLKLHKLTVMKMARQGKIPGVLIAKRWRFKRSDVEAMLNTTKVDDNDSNQNHPGKKPMPLANVVDAPSDMVGVTVIHEEDGQA